MNDRTAAEIVGATAGPTTMWPEWVRALTVLEVVAAEEAVERRVGHMPLTSLREAIGIVKRELATVPHGTIPFSRTTLYFGIAAYILAEQDVTRDTLRNQIGLPPIQWRR